MNREALFPRKIPNGILRNDVSGEARWQRRQITRAQSYHLLGSGADCFVTQGPLVRVSAKQPNSRSRTTAGDSVRGVAELSAVVPRLSPNCPRRAPTPVGSRRLTLAASHGSSAFGRQVPTMVCSSSSVRIPLATPALTPRSTLRRKRLRGYLTSCRRRRPALLQVPDRSCPNAPSVGSAAPCCAASRRTAARRSASGRAKVALRIPSIESH